MTGVDDTDDGRRASSTAPACGSPSCAAVQRPDHRAAARRRRRDGLLRHGVDDDDITVAWVPGAFELPLVAKPGLVRGVRRRDLPRRRDPGRHRPLRPRGRPVRRRRRPGAALDTGVPVVFGVLTTDTIEQAIERAGTKAGNKGSAAMTSASWQLADGRPASAER